MNASLDLRCHPRTPCPVVTSLTVTVTPSADGGLDLRYRLLGDPAGLAIPDPLPAPGPADNLWQHTCCEAFIAGADAAYREFNFSPSGQWAVYAFADYRQRLPNAQPGLAPSIATHRHPDGFTLSAHLGPALLPDGPLLHLGLTAVIETVDGGKHYWALDHLADQPDFHLRRSFTLTLPRPA